MKAKGFLSTVLSVCLAVLTLFSCAGCGEGEPQAIVPPPTGVFYTLKEAYDSGWLTKKDVRSIVYYYQGGDEGFTPKKKDPEVLSAETELILKQAYLQTELKEPNISLDYVKIYNYYGTYNGMIAVHIWDVYCCYDFYFHSKYDVGGITLYDFTESHIYIFILE